MTTIGEITEILKAGFANVCQVNIENIDIYNVEETFPPGTYTYDASVYFEGDDKESTSAVLFDRVANNTTDFNQDILSEIATKEPELASKISMSVEPTSGKFTLSLNKGKTRPQFERIVPVVESFGMNLETPDFLEIKDVSCVRSSTGVTTSFVVHTNLLSEKMYWRIKLSSDPNLEIASGFDNWMRSAVPSQAQSYFTNSTVETTVSNKKISTPFSDLNNTTAFDTLNYSYYVYIMVYFDNSPTFSTLLLKTV